MAKDTDPFRTLLAILNYIICATGFHGHKVILYYYMQVDEKSIDFEK